MNLENIYIGIGHKRELRNHFFTVVFPAINYCFEETFVETSEKFSLIYIFINISLKKSNSKFNNASQFFFENKVLFDVQ